jgi:hypothetical protein
MFSIQFKFIILMMRRAVTVTATAAITSSKSCTHTHTHTCTSTGEDSDPKHARRKKRQASFTFTREKVKNYAMMACLILIIICLFCSFAAGISITSAEKRHSLRLRSRTASASAGGDPNQKRNTAKPKLFERHTAGAPECTPMTAEDVSFTLVTQVSLDRLWMMQYHCERWSYDYTSPISVAVLTNQTTLQTRDALVSLGCHTDQLTVQTMEINDDLEADYPVNQLRRMALSAVGTSHVMYVDIDFWESVDLHDILHQSSVREALAKDPKHALVVPAFQLNRQCQEYRDCRDDNIPKMPRTWQQMIDALMERRGFPFDPTNRGGHGSTLYQQWIRQESGDLLDIPCIQSNRYEPYMAFRYCRDLPPFQTQFSGYGKNKMTWMMQLRREGYNFSQLGGAFVVHYPHLDSVSRMEWNLGPQEIQPFRGDDGKMYKNRPADVKIADWTTYKRGRVDAVFVAFRKWLETEIEDQSRVQMCEDKEDDDTKLWIDRSHTE